MENAKPGLKTSIGLEMLESISQVFIEINFNFQSCSVKGRHSTTWANRLPAILLSIGQISPSATSLGEQLQSATLRSYRSSKETIGYFNEVWSDIVPISRGKKLVSLGNYDDFRDHGIIPLCDNGVAMRNTKVIAKNLNGKDTAYCITEEFLRLLRSYGTMDWADELSRFKNWQTTNISQREDSINVNPAGGAGFTLHNDPHNLIQKQVIEIMLEKFAPGSQLVYTGDTETRAKFFDADLAKRLDLMPLFKEKMPDVVAWYPVKEWLFIIEAVTSTGHIGPSKKEHLEALLGNRKSNTVFVTAFLNRAAFHRFSHDIAWETEVWIANEPNHMIHFNGDRFLGPHF